MRGTFDHSWTTLLAAAVCATVACEKDKEPVTASGPTEAPAAEKPAANAAAPTEERKVTDSEIESAIEREYLGDASVPLGKIEVAVTNGIVELTGKANNILTKERATKIAEAVKGVRSVSNRIEVALAEGAEGQTLAKDVESALLLDPATESYEIQVSAEGHEVTLAGAVESWQERMLAERVAKSVRGVKDVVNDIDVDYGAKRPDAEIQKDVESRLRWSVLIDDALVDVAVEDGKVRLSGTVGSAAEKSRARMDSWVKGVKDVDVSGLRTKWWARNDALRKDKYVTKPDDEVRRAIQDALLYDPRVDSLNVDVKVSAGVATLTGTVNSRKARIAAEEVARHTVGVSATKNLLDIKTKHQPTADMIKKDVERALALNPITESYEIVPVVEGTEVTLEGNVDNYFEKAEAENVVNSIRGVTGVDNEIAVDKTPHAYVYDPYLYPYYPYVETWSFVPVEPTEPDSEIKDEIEDELFWSPFVDLDEITVGVKDGKATLTGTVDTWAEKRSATENAFEGGAVAVDNRLRVGG